MSMNQSGIGSKKYDVLRRNVPGILLTVFLAGCARSAKSPDAAQPEVPPARDGSVGGLAYTVISEDEPGMQLTSSEVSGSGTLLFHRSPGATDTNISYRLSLTISDGGSLTLLSHANDVLTGGVEITFVRNGDQLAVRRPDGSLFPFGSLPPGGVSDVQVVVRNVETPAHVTATGAESLFDSMINGVVLPRGQGERFGLRLSQSVVKSVSYEQVQDDEHDKPQEFTVSDLHSASQKALNRFERMAIAGSAFVAGKTWKTSHYIWTRLTYSIPDASAPGGKKEELLYLACHFHGKDLGCHKKNEAGPDEPPDDIPDDIPGDDFPADDLPPPPP